jgi:radical SAM protein with 4Fe4S-binding SPASM domain
MQVKNWKHVLHFLKKLTFARLVNIAQVNLGYYVKKPFGLPYALAIEPTTSCNLRCPECPSGLRSFTRPTGHIALEKFKFYLDQYAKKAIYLNLYFQGEPYLNPNFLPMVQYAQEKKMYVSSSTNAHYLSKEKALETVKSGLDRLIISIDGTSQATYEQYRIGGSLDKVKEGLANLVAAKKEINSLTPYIVIQFLVLATNEAQLPEIEDLAKSYGADELSLKSAQLYDFENGNELMPKNQLYSRYVLGANGKYKTKHKLENHCWKMWHSQVITWDGKIVPCCFDKDAEHVMGDLNQQTLTDIWGAHAYQSFRKQVLTARQDIKICTNCTEGCKVYN